MSVSNSRCREVLGRHAVVCGAGIAGLLAAYVLSEFYDRVTIIERDELEFAFRRGVPQAAHVHFLQVGAARIIESLMPGLGNELTRHGAHYRCFTSARKRFEADHWAERHDSDLWTHFCSRTLLERVIRHRVVEVPNIELLSGLRVVGLCWNPDGGVRGVRTRPVSTNVEGSSSGERSALCDLVIDTTGRSSRAQQWLSERGYEPPPESIVDGHWGYASQLCRMPERWRPDWTVLVADPAPTSGGSSRKAVISAQEGNRWLFTLAGSARDYPPRDSVNFGSWLSELPCEDFAAAYAQATPTSRISVWTQTFNRLRHYDRVATVPMGILFLGDSVCTLNPIYGQGMALGALAARDLRKTLLEVRSSINGIECLGVHFQRRLAETIRLSWTVSSAADRRIPGARVEVLSEAEDFDLGSRWLCALDLANRDTEIRTLFWETATLVRQPEWLYSGAVASRLVVTRQE